MGSQRLFCAFGGGAHRASAALSAPTWVQPAHPARGVHSRCQRRTTGPRWSPFMAARAIFGPELGSAGSPFSTDCRSPGHSFHGLAVHQHGKEARLGVEGVCVTGIQHHLLNPACMSGASSSATVSITRGNPVGCVESGDARTWYESEAMSGHCLILAPKIMVRVSFFARGVSTATQVCRATSTGTLHCSGNTAQERLVP